MPEWLNRQQEALEAQENPQELRNALFGSWDVRATLLSLTRDEQDLVMDFIDQIQALMNDPNSAVNFRDWKSTLPNLQKGNLEHLADFARNFILREKENQRSAQIQQEEKQMYRRGENISAKTWEVPEDLQALREKVARLEQITARTANRVELLKSTPNEQRFQEVADLLGVSVEELRKGPPA